MSADISKRNLPMLFLKARETLLSHFRPILKHYGLTEQQWRIIRELAELGTAEPNQLCQACVILSPSMVGVLDRLHSMGLITRSKASYDRRRVLIKLSPRGERLYHAMAPLIEKQYRLIEQTIGDELVDQAYDLMDKLLNAPIEDTPNVPTPNTEK